MTAQAAAEKLGISRATLYAYVSRGLLRSEPSANGVRSRRYRLDDVQALLRRQEQRRDPTGAIDGALHWGAPMIDSGITRIASGSIYYRGKDAIALSRTASVEEAAGWLWSRTESMSGWERSELQSDPAVRTIIHAAEALPPIHRFSVALAAASAGDISACDLRPVAVTATGARILRRLATSLSGQPDEQSIAAMLASGWGGAAPLMSTALILCADHELTASTFTARCAASTGANPYAVVGAGLAALQGPKHGGQTARVEALFREVREPREAREAIESRVRRGEPVPGFGHPLYPDGDPRARRILEAIDSMLPENSGALLAHSIETAVLEVAGERPTIDFALTALCRALGRASGSALGLFALGRTIGWIGHAMEEYAENRMIRPRARYTGE